MIDVTIAFYYLMCDALRGKAMSGQHAFLAAIVITGISLSLSSTLFSENKKREYVGSEICGKCHSSDAIGNQYDLWRRSPHAKAVAILTEKSGRAIAEKSGVQSPSTDRRCLRCHTTGGGRNPVTAAEGVGCEACHGPGKDYHEYAKHVDTVNREGGYETALKNGMYPILGIKNIKKREKLCLRCHTGDRPCYPTDPKEIYRQSITLQTIAEMRKGDLNLKHPLIPPFPQY